MQHRLIWFRDDLRVTDNAAVSAALDCDPNTRISAVFLTAESDWASFGYGPNRLYYTQQLLTALSTSLASLGICLTVIRLKTYHDQVAWIGRFCATECVSDLYFNQEYQWNERLRDRQIRDHAGSVTVHAFVDRVLLQPSTVLTGDERFYSVFSPFKRRWLSIYQDQGVRSFALPPRSRAPVEPSQWLSLCDQPDSDLSQFPMTEEEAQRALEDFVTHRLGHYDRTRNQPDVAGTSRLSGALARGLLSPRQCIQAAEDQIQRPIWEFPDNAFSWINELIWRDFYQHLLVGFPRLSKNRAFRKETEALAWRNLPTEIDAWKAGRTGIPIVDAGMRELKATG